MALLVTIVYDSAKYCFTSISWAFLFLFKMSNCQCSHFCVKQWTPWVSGFNEILMASIRSPTVFSSVWNRMVTLFTSLTKASSALICSLDLPKYGKLQHAKRRFIYIQQGKSFFWCRHYHQKFPSSIFTNLAAKVQVFVKEWALK